MESAGKNADFCFLDRLIFSVEGDIPHDVDVVSDQPRTRSHGILVRR